MDTQGEVHLFGAQGARLLDVELVAVLLDGDLQVIVFGQLSLHDVNPFTGKQEVNDKSGDSVRSEKQDIYRPGSSRNELYVTLTTSADEPAHPFAP